jgi:hypothetical protein
MQSSCRAVVRQLLQSRSRAGGEVVQESRCRGAKRARTVEKVKRWFRSAEVHWCGGAEVQVYRYSDGCCVA